MDGFIGLFKGINLSMGINLSQPGRIGAGSCTDFFSLEKVPQRYESEKLYGMERQERRAKLLRFSSSSSPGLDQHLPRLLGLHAGHRVSISLSTSFMNPTWCLQLPTILTVAHVT